MKRKLARGMLFAATWIAYGVVIFALLVYLPIRFLEAHGAPLLIRATLVGLLFGLWGIAWIFGGQKLADYVCTTKPWRRIFSSKAE